MYQPENELERLLVLAADDPSQRARFQQHLLQSDLYAATPEAPQGAGWHTVEAGEELRIANVTGPDGNLIPALFTSETRVAEAFGADTGFVSMNGEALLAIVANHGAALNPGGSYGVHWTAENLAAMLGHSVKRTIEKRTELMLGLPSERPDQLIGELRTSLNHDPRILSAWLALAFWPETKEWSWYLDIGSDAPHEDITHPIAEAIKRAGDSGHPVDVLVNPSGGDEGTGIRIKPAETH